MSKIVRKKSTRGAVFVYALFRMFSISPMLTRLMRGKTVVFRIEK